MATKTSQWTDVYVDLPPLGVPVLWKHESGYVKYDFIDKDMDDHYVYNIFLKGNQMAGPITHWMHVPE